MEAKKGIVINETTEMGEEPHFKRDADQYLPIANVTRIMRSTLPTNAKIADDAKETIQACVSEFICFVTTLANEKCKEDYRKTIAVQDILAAMADLGFDRYIEPLTSYFDNIHNQGSERHTKQQRFHARGETNFGDRKRQAMVAHVPLTNYAPSSEVYDSEYGVRMSQMNNYYVQGPTGRHGEGSSKNLGFNPYN